MTDPLSAWSAGPFLVLNHGEVRATARFFRGISGEIVAAFECEMPDCAFDALFLRYDASRQSVDVITCLDLQDGFGLSSTEPIPEELLWEFEVAGDAGSPDPDRLFQMMNRVNCSLGLVAAPSN